MTPIYELNFRVPSKMGVRERRHECDRRAGHLALLRLTLPDGAGRTSGSGQRPDDDGVRVGVDRRHPTAPSRR